MPKEKFVCDWCGDKFSSKEDLINHLEAELEEAREIASNAEDDILGIEKQLAELESKEKEK